MSKVLNVILCVIFIFLLSFCWAYFSLKSVNISLITASVLSIASSYILWQATKSRSNKQRIKKQRETNLTSLLSYLQFNDDNAELFSKLLTYYGFKTQRVDYDNLLAVKEERSCFIAIDFSQDSLSKEAVRQTVVNAKRRKASQIYFFCAKCDNPTQATANSHMPSTFVDLQNVYALFEQAEMLPKFKAAKTTKKMSFVAKYAFNRKRFGWYLGSSLFTMLISLFSYLRYYTLAWSTVFFALALYCLFNKRYNATPTQVTLD